MKKVLFAATSLLALSTVTADAATFINRSGATAYVHIEYPSGGVTNFTLPNGQSHDVNIGNGHAYYCWATWGRIDRCQARYRYRITNDSRRVLD
ncbi:MAG: hypothetical protein AAF366_19855 [Pseudomonadota bacterium]